MKVVLLLGAGATLADLATRPLKERPPWTAPLRRIDTRLLETTRTGEEGRSPDETVRGRSEEGPLDR